MFSDDGKIYEFLKSRLFTAAVCDILDGLGYKHQAMHHRLRPLLPDPENCGFVGRALTLRWMQTDYIYEEDPYGLEIEAMDSIKHGNVLIHSTELGCNCAPWGELMTTVAKRNGAAGCVCDNGIRDCTRIIKLGFPVYYTAINPLDSKGRARVMDINKPVRCGDVLVQPGEIVFADYDGIVVIPKSAEKQVLELAIKKVETENIVRKELQAGKTLREAYNKHKIL